MAMKESNKNGKLREEKAALALRENLKRRKQQQQAWASLNKSAPDNAKKD